MTRPPPQRPTPKLQSPMNRPKPGTGGAPVAPNPKEPPESAIGNLAATKRPPWYKRKYLVYPKFQLTLIFLNSLVTFVLFGMTALLVIRSHTYLESLVRQTRIPAQNLFTQLLTQQLRSLLFYMGIALVLGVLVTAVTTLLLSHKMAGPMIRLRNFFAQISKTGDFPETLNFRNGDFFQDLPPMINQALNALKRKWNR